MNALPEKYRASLLQDYSQTFLINEADFYALRLLSEALQTSIKLTKEEIAFLNDFLNEFIQNPAKYTSLEKSLPAGKTKSVEQGLICIQQMAFRTRHLNELDKEFFRQIELVDHKLASSLELFDEDKISLRQYAIMHDLSALHTTLNKLSKLELLPNSELHEKARHCLNVEKTIGLKVKVAAHFSPGLFTSESSSTQYFSYLSKILLKKQPISAPKPSPNR